MAVDVAAVIGRQLGVPLLGSIELIQACVVLAASSALVGATLAGSHAAVHVVTERLPARARGWLARCSDGLCLLFFLWLAIGAIWIAAELWHGHEATELLRLPIAPLRLVFCASLLIVASLFLRALFRPRGERA